MKTSGRLIHCIKGAGSKLSLFYFVVASFPYAGLTSESLEIRDNAV